MKLKSIETMFTVFCKFDSLESNISVITKYIPDNFERTSQYEMNPQGIQYQVYLFRNKENTIVLRPFRIDCSYTADSVDSIDIFMNLLKSISTQFDLHINRIALNYSSFVEDKDFTQLQILVNSLNLYNFNIKNELTLRFNSLETAFDTQINNITLFQSGVVTNNATFEKLNAIILNKDINTIADTYVYSTLDSLEKDFLCLYSLLKLDIDKLTKMITGGVIQ